MQSAPATAANIPPRRQSLSSIDQLEASEEWFAVGSLSLGRAEAGGRRLSYRPRGDKRGVKAMGFQRYLFHRYIAGGGGLWSIGGEGLARSFRGIRAGTYNLLSRRIPPFRGVGELLYHTFTVRSPQGSAWIHE